MKFKKIKLLKNYTAKFRTQSFYVNIKNLVRSFKHRKKRPVLFCYENLQESMKILKLKNVVLKVI